MGMSDLLPIGEAQSRLLARAALRPIEQAPLPNTTGRWLAEPLHALRDQPWTDLSAMDGYAIRYADLPGPWQLVGASQAGSGPADARLAPGTTMRIFTGAPLPPDADTIVIQEDIKATGDLIALTGDGPGANGAHVRRLGSDFLADAPLLPAGISLDPSKIALAALAGHGALPVRMRPRVAIISTGDELVQPGAPCPPGKLPASNGAMLRAMIERAGGVVLSDTLVGDDLAAISDALTQAQEADIIVTSGGASVGDHDLVKPALEAAGGQIDFWRIAMRPGKPLIVGDLGQSIFLGLPGNPVSALVTGALFLLPLIRHMAGASVPVPPPVTARLGTDLASTGRRDELIRAIHSNGTISPLVFQDSAAMHAAAQANALIWRRAGSNPAKAGDSVDMLDWRDIGLA